MSNQYEGLIVNIGISDWVFEKLEDFLNISDPLKVGQDHLK